MTRRTRRRAGVLAVAVVAALSLGAEARAPAVPVGAAGSAPPAAKAAPGEIPVLFVHGFDENSGKDCEDTFGEALGYFEASGRDRSSLVTVGYYSGDDRCDVDVTDDPTDNDTRIKHIAAAFANHLYDQYTRQGQSVDIVAHSMGGLVTRVALLGSAKGWDGFPSEPILVDDVVTLATPHQGVRCEEDEGEDCPHSDQWRSMDPDSTFMQVLHSPSHRLDEEWAAPYDWTFVGSAEDGVVSYGSAIDKTRPADHKFGYQGGDQEGTISHSAVRTLYSGDFNLHYWHADEDETHETDNGWAPLETAFNAIDRNDDW
jgi:pimeloyl-ACP methyl ester carboxylesterase